MPEAINPKYFSYGAIGIGLLGFLAAFVGGGGIMGLLGGLFAGLGSLGAILFYRYGYLVMPLVTQRTRIVQIMEGGYEIPPAQDAILKKVGGMYYASVFLGVRIYESYTEKSPEERAVYTEYYERAISGMKFVAKFCMLLYVKDLSEHRERLETKRAEAQLRLQREREKTEPDVLKLDRYEREVAMWEGEIAKLTKGEKPMGALSYIMTTAVGVSKEAALAAAKAQAGELKATVGNALNVEVVQLTGDEMLKCFDWEHIIPPTPQDLEQQVG